MSEPMARVLAALADDTRRGIVAELAEGVTPTATELAEHRAISRQAVTKHLRTLQDAHLVTATREGRETRYRLEPEALRTATDWIERIHRRWEHQLVALKDQVERASERGPDSSDARGTPGR